ncbi:hypothetical protein ACG7TL_000359 [Trametes sanguinea]
MLSFLSSWILPSSRSSDLKHHHTHRGAELDSPSFDRDGSPDFASSVQPGHSDSTFFSVLTAPYEPLAPPPRIITPPNPPISSVNQLNATVAWTDPEPEEDDLGSESEDDEEMDLSELPEQARESLDQPAYQPVAKFSWATGLPLSGSELLYNIHVERSYSLSIMRGKIGDRDMTYLCKRWWRAARSSWKGFYAELKLFSSPLYLRDMQGCGIPYLINLYSGADAISFLMALPHQSFWIEASADMPNELKKQVIITYIALHARGVLHGSPELHNMLVGGDGRVTLIDFHAARARKPIPELGIEAVTRAELDLELRQVMFKLDYEGARKREYARMKRLQPLWDRLAECTRQGLPLEKIPIDELRDPPPSWEHWKRDWINSLNGRPRRFVVPGQTPEEYRQASAAFCQMLEDWHELEKKDAVSPLIYIVPSSPPHSRAPSPTPSSSSAPSPAEPSPPSSAPEANRRKRKKESGPDDTPPPSKRPRGADLPNGSIPPPPRYERKTTSYDAGEAVKLLPAAGTTKSEPRADRVRDFAHEPYDGPRGYYFPHPPTEARRDMMRIVKIRNENAIACGEEGLPYYRLDRGFLSPPAFKRCLVKGLHVARGTLKRQRDEAEHPVSLSQQQRAKRQRFEDDRRAALSEDRIVWFNDTVSYQDPPREEDYERGPAGSTSSAPVPRSHRPSASTARPRRSILKPTRPVKTVSYNLAKWGGQASLDAGLSFYTAKSPFEILGMQQTRLATQGGDSQLASPSNASDKPVQQPSGSGAVDAQPGSSAPSEGLSQTRLESTLTNDEIAVAAESPALDGQSMFRASDVAPATRDLRSNAALRGEAGSRYGRVSSLKTHDLEEELEVEAILIPRDE